MSRETVILLVAVYIGVLSLVLSVLATAKRADEAAATERATEARDEEPRRRDAA